MAEEYYPGDYSLFTPRKPRPPLRINVEQGFLRMNRLCACVIFLSLLVQDSTDATGDVLKFVHAGPGYFCVDPGIYPTGIG